MFSAADPTAQTAGGLAACATRDARLAREPMLVMTLYVLCKPSRGRPRAARHFAPIEERQKGLVAKCIPSQHWRHYAQVPVVPHAQREVPCFPAVTISCVARP